MHNDENSFNDPKVALDWIETIEGEKGRIRDSDIYPQLNAWINSASPLEVLDIGSGQGICSDHINLDERHYTGIDPSPLLIERAKKLYPQKNRKFIEGSVYDLPFPDCTFDAAFSIAVWHLLHNLEKAAEELCRILNESGHFLIITANPDAYSLWPPDLHAVSKLYSLHEILDSLKAANLTITKTETFRSTESSNGKAMFLTIEGRRLKL